MFAAVAVAVVVSLVWQSAPAFRHSGFSFSSSAARGSGQGSTGPGSSSSTPSSRRPSPCSSRCRSASATPSPCPNSCPGAWPVRSPPAWTSWRRPQHRGRPLGTAGPRPPFRAARRPVLAQIPLVGLLFKGPSLGPASLGLGRPGRDDPAHGGVAQPARRSKACPVADREAAVALGGTRWQVVRRAVLPGARTGIEAAVTLAMGRALGEAIAVALVIGGGVTLPIRC